MSDSRRLPARVYWVRRLVVLGIPLLVIAVVVWFVAGRGSGDDKAPAAQTTSSAAVESPEPSPTPSEPSSGVPDCAPPGLALAMTPDATSYAPGVPATFTVTITNTGTDPCLVDAGEAQREIVITSGEDRVWSNRDCIVPGTESRTLLLPGGESDASAFAWNQTRSAEGCPQGLPAPGAGTYSAQLVLAGASAPPAVFGLG